MCLNSVSLPTWSESGGVQPWVIGVLVVGLLGLVATIFCVMGMYLACRADKTDPGKRQERRKGAGGGEITYDFG